MCGRFVSNFLMAELIDSLEKSGITNVDAADCQGPHNYNGAPTQLFPVVVASHESDLNSEKVSLKVARWGLVPRWMKDDKSASRMINARIETVREKPSFKGLLGRHRCLVPMNGYFEWNRDNPRKKIPFFISDSERGIVFAAGLWTTAPVSGDIATFTMLTEDAPLEVAHVHNRAPVLLDPVWMRDWLSDPAAPVEALISRSRSTLVSRRVSSRVNSVRNNDSHLVDEVHDDPDEVGLFPA